MTIERAIEILNRERWRDRDDWQARADYEVISEGIEAEIPRVNIYVEDAIAIAEGIEAKARATEAEEQFDEIRKDLEIAIGDTRFSVIELVKDATK